MATHSINTLNAAKKFIDSGFTVQQAEGMSETISEMIETRTNSHVTQVDLEFHIESLRKDMAQKIHELNQKIGFVAHDLNLKIEYQGTMLSQQMNLMRMEISADMEKRFVDVDKRFAEVDKRFVEIEYRFVKLEHNLLVKMGALITVLFTIFTGVTQFG